MTKGAQSVRRVSIDASASRDDIRGVTPRRAAVFVDDNTNGCCRYGNNADGARNDGGKSGTSLSSTRLTRRASTSTTSAAADRGHDAARPRRPAVRRRRARGIRRRPPLRPRLRRRTRSGGPGRLRRRRRPDPPAARTETRSRSSVRQDPTAVGLSPCFARSSMERMVCAAGTWSSSVITNTAQFSLSATSRPAHRSRR